MFSFLVDLPDVMIQPISDYLKEIVNLNNQTSNQEKLIIFACMEEADIAMIFFRQLFLRYRDERDLFDVESTLAFFRFLLRFGADADAVDGDGNGPLHFLATKPNGELTNSIALLLLDAGTHLDRANKNRLTAADVWKQKRQAGGWQELPEWLLGEDVPRLMCLAARSIRSHRIPYLKVLPPLLKSFVSFH